MAFLLSVTYRDDGFTHIVLDNGPTSRVNLLAPPGASNEVLNVQPAKLLRDTFTEVRGPAVNRRRLK